MKPLHILLLLLAAFSLPETSSAEELGEEWGVKSVEEISAWIKEFDHVEAVVYNPFEVIESRRLVEAGKLHPGVAKAWTKRLTVEDVAVLKTLISGKHKATGGSLCYYPRHGFIFFGKNSEILGHIEICFSCGNYYPFPETGLSENWDLLGLKNLAMKVGLPVFNTDEEWKAFFADKEKLARGSEKAAE